ncbi:MAG: type II toxin-antitoxin system Phd/YefM family antitoxin [Acidobacteria bacterium]|nr:type II toxin-antitoxin system Phd/YefM family antitoxin [Acidobacteriota bacterium]
MVMIMVNIFEAKAKLSEFVEAASRGERVVICNRNRPVAELRPVAAAPAPRRLGSALGSVEMDEGFNDPLPDDLLELFEGGRAVRRGAKVAAPQVRYSTPRRKGRR